MKFQLISLRLIREIVRDKRTLAFFLLVPLLIMTLIHYALVEDETANIGVIFRGATRLFEGDVLAALEKNTDIRVLSTSVSDNEIRGEVIERGIEEDIRSGRVDGVLYFPREMLSDRFDNLPGSIRLYVEGSRPTITSVVYSAVSDVLDEVAASLPVVMDEECSTDCANSVNNQPLELEEKYLYGSEDTRMLDYFLPVFPPFFIFFLTFVISTVTFQRERVGGTLERLQIAPIRLNGIISGYVGGFFIFATLQSAIIIGYILFLIQTPFSPVQALALFTVCLLTMLVALMIGLLASFLAANEFQAIQFIPLIILPQIFLSDLIWNIEKYPAFFRGLAYLFPLTHANFLTREVMIKGHSLFSSLPQLAVLLAYIPITMTALWGAAQLHRSRG